MKQHQFKLISELNNIEYKNMVLDLIGEKMDSAYDYWVKMFTVKVAYSNNKIINEIGLVIVATTLPGTEQVYDMYAMPAFPFVLRTDADIRAYESLVELYVKDRDELIEFRDISA